MNPLLESVQTIVSSYQLCSNVQINGNVSNLGAVLQTGSPLYGTEHKKVCEFEKPFFV